MDFRARYDRTAVISTSIVCAILLLVGLIQPPIPLALSLLIIALGFAYSPRGYTVEGTDVIVRRLSGKVRISGISDARRATPDDLSWTLRLFGSGGLFGYYGLFRTSRLGSAWWYVTDRNHVVILTANGKPVLVSPDDPERFLAALNITATRPSQVGPVPVDKGAWIGVAVAVMAAVAIIGSLAYSPGPPSYTLTPRTLEIHDFFYPVTIGAHDVDIDAIRVVDINKDKEWKPTLRVGGIANPRYKAGWFRTANGRRVRLYRTSSTLLVLLPPKAQTEPVLIEVQNPEVFTAELRRTWITEPHPASAR